MKVKISFEKGEKVIHMIPRGKKFTLEEFFDYTQEINWESLKKMSEDWMVSEFFTCIGYYPDCVTSIAFKVALSLKTISNNAIVKKVYNLLKEETFEDKPYYNKRTIINILNQDFNNWLEERKDIVEHCTNASLINLISYFAKKAKEDKEKARIALEQKISKIPDGKSFTLSEYLEYTQEYRCDINHTRYMEKAGDFMEGIEYPITPCSIMAFGEAIFLSKDMSYENISKAIDMPGNTVEENIEILKKEFNIWLEKRPDVRKYCPDANVIQLLEYFKKKATENENN